MSDNEKLTVKYILIGMTKIKLIVLTACAATLASCGGSSDKSSGAPEFPVRKVQTQSVDMQTTYPATFKGVQDVEIRPKVSGNITELRVNEGQAVRSGEVLFVIDDITYKATERQAKAAVEAAEAECSTAKLTYENSQKLYDNNVIGDYELQSSRNAYESAKAALAQAEANLVSAQDNLSYCYVKSPSDGIVGDLPYKVGALVSSSITDPLTTVSKISTMQIYFSMTEKELLDFSRTAGNLHAAIADYPAVKLQLADGTIYDHEGKLASVSGVIDPNTGSVSMRADFDNPDHLLKSGGSGTIVVPYTDSAAVVIPQASVTQVQDQYFVYVVGADNKVKYTNITVNPENDGVNYIVESGLNPGESFVVSGTSSLSDGMEITPITEEEYEKQLKEAAAMGADQGDLDKLKDDLSN